MASLRLSVFALSYCGSTVLQIVNEGFRGAQHFRYLVHLQSTEKTQLDNSRLLGIQGGEFFDGIIDGQQVFVVALADLNVVCQVHTLSVATTFNSASR